MDGKISFVILAVLTSGFSMEIPSARAQAASEFAPLPTKPAKPKPAKVTPAEPPAPARVESPAAPEPAIVIVPVETEPKPAAEAPKEVPAPPASAETPKPAAPPTAAEKKALEKELAIEQAKEKAKEAAIDKKKKVAAEKKEKSEKMAKEPPEPKTERTDLKNPKLPADDKGPRAIEFITKCLDNYDRCMAYVNEAAQKIPSGDVCLQSASDQQEITEKVRKFITLRPAIHDQAANRVVTEALYVIYPCKRAAPERTAGKKK